MNYVCTIWEQARLWRDMHLYRQVKADIMLEKEMAK